VTKIYVIEFDQPTGSWGRGQRVRPLFRRGDAPTLACARGADDGVRPYTSGLVSGSGQLNPLPNIAA